MRKEMSMLRVIVFVLVVLWLLGGGLHFAGNLIHVLLGIALVVLLVDLIGGRRRAL